MKPIATVLSGVVTALLACAGAAGAQPVITAPSNGQVFPAGPDYATDVLQDPWDFANIEDLSQHPDDYLGWTQSPNARTVGPAAFGVGSGKFTATSDGSGDPIVGLLYQGSTNLPDPERTGQHYPVDANRYGKIAFKMKAANAGTTQSAVYWFFGGKGAGAIGSAFAPTLVTTGDAVYQIDLRQNFSSGTPFDAGAPVTGIRLDPINNTSSASVELDWVRLTAPDNGPGAAMMTVQTTCSGAKTVDVVDGGGTATRVLANSGAGGSFNYGIFPPGSYTLRVGCNGGTAEQAFTINDPPRITVLQPGTTTGDDYATTVLGNRWDMDDAADVPLFANLASLGLVSSPLGGLMARGANVVSANPSVMGDPNLYLLYGERGRRPIASTHYRYLTFSTQLHHSFEQSATDGSMARILWASAAGFDGNTATQTKDILIWPGFRTYTVDLASLVPGAGLEGCSPAATCSWVAGSPRFLRFDPHEFGTMQVTFDLDNVMLTAAPEVTQGGTFKLQWQTQGASAGTVNLYYDTDRNPDNGRTAIATNLPIGTTAYDWHVGSTPRGDYYIYVEASESAGGGVDKRGAYSPAVVRVLGAFAPGTVSIDTVAPGSTIRLPFSIAGCAYDGQGGADDEVVVYAHPLQGQMGGAVQLLGHNPAGGMGTLGRANCASGPGYQVSNIVGLTQGAWTIRVLGRNTLTGNFDEVQAENVVITGGPGPARNLRITGISGNTVAIAWDPPLSGTVRSYRIEAAGDPSFAHYTPILVPASTTAVQGTLGNGTYYVRVRTANDYTADGPVSNVVDFTLPIGAGGTGDPPGAPTLIAQQVSANPVVLRWTAGAGALPSSYVLFVGTAPGTYNLGSFNLGLQTAISANAPAGPIYARVVAVNSGGSAGSNEIHFALAGPPPPVLQPATVSGNTVTLNWTPQPGAPATGYRLIVRVPGSTGVLLAVPVGGTGIQVPNAPRGSYAVSVVAVNGIGTSAESNSIIVNVP